MPRTSDAQPGWSTWLDAPPAPNTAPNTRDRQPPIDLTPADVYDLPEGQTNIEASFRHGFWASRRRRTYAALQAAQVKSARLANFRCCGSCAYLEVEQASGQMRLRSIKCRDRFCQACAMDRSRRLARALAERCRQHRTLHVVLTLRSCDAPLGDQLARLYKCAARLRGCPWWRRRVKGGSITVEITRNQETKQWHPHAHLLVHADWIPHAELSEQWHRVTKDSRIVHVSLVQRHEAAAREVTKYLAKPLHRSIDGDHWSTIELIHALRGRRLITTFGSWRKDPLLKDDAPEDAGTWKRECSLVELHDRASAGDEWARAALRYLVSLRPGRIHVDPPKVSHPTHDSGPTHDAAP